MTADLLLGRVYPARTVRVIRTGVGVVALLRLVRLVPQLRAAADPATAEPLLWGGVVTPGTWPVIALLWAAAASHSSRAGGRRWRRGRWRRWGWPCWAPTRPCSGATCTFST